MCVKHATRLRLILSPPMKENSDSVLLEDEMLTATLLY
jgi:hypothetical protein